MSNDQTGITESFSIKYFLYPMRHLLLYFSFLFGSMCCGLDTISNGVSFELADDYVTELLLKEANTKIRINLIFSICSIRDESLKHSIEKEMWIYSKRPTSTRITCFFEIETSFEFLFERFLSISYSYTEDNVRSHSYEYVRFETEDKWSYIGSGNPITVYDQEYNTRINKIMIEISKLEDEKKLIDRVRKCLSLVSLREPSRLNYILRDILNDIIIAYNSNDLFSVISLIRSRLFSGYFDLIFPDFRGFFETFSRNEICLFDKVNFVSFCDLFLEVLSLKEEYKPLTILNPIILKKRIIINSHLLINVVKRDVKLIFFNRLQKKTNFEADFEIVNNSLVLASDNLYEKGIAYVKLCVGNSSNGKLLFLESIINKNRSKM